MTVPAGGAALAEPVAPVGHGWTATLSLANGAIWVGWYGPLQILLAVQAAAVAPPGVAKESVLAWVTGAGAVVSLLANPLFGAVSDRTVSRFGRRTPWIVAGVVSGGAALVWLSGARTVWSMAAGWCLVQLTLNAAFAAVTAAVPDQVPRAQRGTVGGWLGAAQILGVLAGTGLATSAPSLATGYAACAVCTVLAALPYVLCHRDPVLPAAARPPLSARAFLAGFAFSPRRHPDLGWAWLTRFLINLGNALALLYLLYFLRDALHRPDPASVAGGVARSRRIASAISDRSSTRTDSWSVACSPYSTARSSSRSASVRPDRFSSAASSVISSAAVMPSLSRTPSGSTQ
ncbi:MFS transporter [Streptomyces benahoarensis]|nr:MFS transporter [Streptomyces benahoarensis]